MAGQGVLALIIEDEAALYRAYMPFLKGGGLFVPGHEPCELGSELFLLLQLLNEPVKIPVVGKVVWLTPPRAMGTRVRGMGLQFNDPDGVARTRIETLLSGRLDSATPTHTL